MHPYFVSWMSRCVRGMVSQAQVEEQDSKLGGLVQQLSDAEAGEKKVGQCSLVRVGRLVYVCAWVEQWVGGWVNGRSGQACSISREQAMLFTLYFVLVMQKWHVRCGGG